MNVLKAVAQALGCFVLGVDHFGKNLEAGTRGASTKESSRRCGAGVPGRQGAQRQRHQHPAGGAEEQRRPAGAGISRSRCGWLRRRSRTRTASRSPRWWWTGCRPGQPAAPPPPDDPWLEGCRRDDQRAVMSRLKRVLMATLAEHGVERPIPSATSRPNFIPLIGDEVSDAKLRTARSCEWSIRRSCGRLSICARRGHPRQTQHSRF